MEHSLKVMLGGLLGTLAIFYFLKLGKGQVRPDLIESRSSGVDPSGRQVSEAEATLEGMRDRAEESDKQVKRQLAIAQLKAFLFAVRKNRHLAH